ncbi:Pre-mRNA-splicing factor [Lachnellula hyalina]|uniref:Pre-mRNA-splicing factor SYF2 n=1 Tax=Lachnellula hyalina TaxID=1316788 RepID=A0A8H8R8X0_9HELO|nr:Pre-mRNA-splicing factor [Lachnellula hyalina]TVY30736.1 Pre-mRNA-splicing factor [Lachnellula hyalina]
MPPAKKRKTRATVEPTLLKQHQSKRKRPHRKSLPPLQPPTKQQPEPKNARSDSEPSKNAQKQGQKKNLKEATLESQRLATDPNLLTSLNRKSAIAQHNLMKADAEASGEDFERKRAWDWTIDESERWDKRIKKKGAHRDDQAFQDYRQDSRKVYKRQIRDLKPDMEHYEKEKMAAVEKAAASGGLEIVETDDGELVAVDKDGTFYSTADSTGFVDNRPPKDAVDRLVKDLQQAEDARLKKRRERMGAAEDGDVTYINEKNKQFNSKLNRFYNKYTAEIRDSFERGTMI